MPRELSQTTVKVLTGPVRVTIPDPSDTLGFPVVKKLVDSWPTGACQVPGSLHPIEPLMIPAE